MPTHGKTHGSGCPIAFALDIFGDRWTLLVLRDLLLMGKDSFSEFRDSSEGIATNVLADRLRRLEHAGLIRSSPDPADGRKVRYALTEAGLDLIPAMLEIVGWGARHDPDTKAPASFLRRLEKDRDGLVRELAARHRGATD